MSDDNDGSIRLSRRRTLAALGTVGAAAGIGGIGTMAQFSDTEDATMSFTAGGVDGMLAHCATYNTKPDASTPAVVTESHEVQNGVGVQVALEDVKPGDYGSITFGLEVTNNAAWVASCLGIEEDSDHDSFEPEREIEGQNEGSDPDAYSSDGAGELAESLLLIPFYSDDELCATFFDDGWPNEDYGPDDDIGIYGNPQIPFDDTALGPQATAINAAFWNSREGENDFDQLQPQTLREAASSALSTGTVYWNDDGPVICPAPQGTEVDEGCVFLDGAAANGNVDVDARDATPLEPGDTLHFGYDWHIPFGVGNEVQGDRVLANFGFVFSQTRHTEAPSLSNVYSPGSTPAGGA